MSEAEKISEECMECGLCVENCEFLSKYCESPKELADKYLEDHFKDKPSIPYCCSLCDGCEVDCPEDLNIGHMCLEARRTLVEEGVAPLTPHKIVKKDQDWDLSEEFTLSIPNPSKKQVSKVFFPGCHLPGYSADLVISAFEWLREKTPDIGILLRCCGAPTNYIGDKAAYQVILDDLEAEVKKMGAEEIIAACPNCLRHFRRYAPHLKIKSLYEAMVEMGPAETGASANGAVFTIHDPCPARGQTAIHDSIRTIVGWSGCQINEMKESRDETQCCGQGGGVPYISPQIAANATKRRIEQLIADVVTYCGSCREAFVAQKPSLHVLDLIFNTNWSEDKSKPANKPPAKKENKSSLKARLQEKYADEL